LTVCEESVFLFIEPMMCLASI